MSFLKKENKLSRSRKGDDDFDEPKAELSRRARRNEERAEAKQAKADATAAGKQAKAEAKAEAEQAKLDAEAAKKQSKIDAKAAAEADKQARADAKAAAKQAGVDAKAAAEQAKIDAKQAKIDDRAAAKQAKVDAKAEAKQAKVDATQAKVDAKFAAKQAKVDETAAAKQARAEAEAAKKQAEVDAKAEKQRARAEAKTAKKSARKPFLRSRKGNDDWDAAESDKPKKVKAPKQPKLEKQKQPKQPKARSGRSKSRELVGLKVGASHISASRVVNNGSRQLVQLVREPLAPGVIAAGEVRDPTGLADALSAFFTKHSLPRKGVQLGLSNSRVGVRLIEIAGIEDDLQLANAIGFRAHEMLSVPMDEAVIDWHVVGEDVDETGAVTKRILLVVAYRDSVDRYLAATDQAGIELAGIDLEAFALLRAVSEPPPAGAELPEAALVVITVGHERTTLAISNGRVCEFTRVLEWGGSEVTAAIARALKISPAEADELKHSLSLDGANGADDVPQDAHPSDAVTALRFELQTLVRELLSSLRFYQGQPGSLALGEILVSGGMVEMPGFTEELERELGVRVRIADPLARVDVASSVDSTRAGALAVAIGLGIED